MTAAIFDPSEVLSYPPPPLPDHACTCRLRYDKSRIPMACPQPWSTPAGNSSVRGTSEMVEIEHSGAQLTWCCTVRLSARLGALLRKGSAF